MDIRRKEVKEIRGLAYKATRIKGDEKKIRQESKTSRTHGDKKTRR